MERFEGSSTVLGGTFGLGSLFVAEEFRGRYVGLSWAGSFLEGFCIILVQDSCTIIAAMCKNIWAGR